MHLKKKRSTWGKGVSAKREFVMSRNYLERELDVEGTRAPMWKVKMPPR